MTKEQFIALGLTDEQATKAAEESKKELETYIPKSRFDEVNNAKKKAEEDVKARDKQIEELKKVDPEKLKDEITKLQGENKAQKEKYEADLKDSKLTAAIKLAINGKAQDEELVSGLFDKSKLVLGEDGTVTGIDEQLKVLQEGKAFLFKQEQQQTLSGFKPNITNVDTNSTEQQLILLLRLKQVLKQLESKVIMETLYVISAMMHLQSMNLQHQSRLQTNHLKLVDLTHVAT